MKGKTFKTILLGTFFFSLAFLTFAQNGNGAKYTSAEDSLRCGEYLSAYRTFFKLGLYDDAFETWWPAFNECPTSSVRMYVDGVTMYRHLIEEAPEGSGRDGLIDTLMLIYDQRMEYLGDEGNVLGRKGRDLINYRVEDLDEVEKAYEMLRKSVELSGTKTKDAVMLLFISSGITLNKENRLDDNQLIANYLQVGEILDKLEGRSSRWERTRQAIDEMMLSKNILSCESLNAYYEPIFEENKNEIAFLEQVIFLYTETGCDRTDIYVTASEDLYAFQPGPESAHNLAILFITRNDFDKAAVYLREAVQGENIDGETRAEWYYELAVLSSANEDYCEAIDYAREAIQLNSMHGKAYVVLGDAFIASREDLGDEFQQRTAFWAAADQYQKALSLDPEAAEEARQKLDDYAGQYPNAEDVFFHDMKDGDSFRVGGCINESTTVRSRK